MRAFTIENGELVVKWGIRVSVDGQAVVGESGRGRKLIMIDLPVGTKIIDGVVFDIPGSDDTAAVVKIRDQSGYRGGWELTAPRTLDEYRTVPEAKPARAPHGLRIIAEGECAQGDAGRMGGGPEYIAIIAVGQSAEIVRHGRLYDAPQVIKIEWDGRELRLSDPIAAAESNLAASRW